MIPTMERQENLVVAAHQMLELLEKKRNLTNDDRKVLAELGTRLSSMAKITETKDENKAFAELEEHLTWAHDKVMAWEVEQSMIWDCGPEEVNDYLKAVIELWNLIEKLESLNPLKDSKEGLMLRKGYDVLQTAMARVEEAFRHMLVHNRQNFEPEHLSFRSSEEDVVDYGSIASFGDESIEESSRRDSTCKPVEEYIIDLVNPDILPDLKCIASLMFKLNYGKECSQAFISVRKDTLDGCLFILEVERSSIEDVLNMEWGTLNSKMRKWTRAMKVLVRVYLPSEKFLGYRIFGELDRVSAACFTESSKACMLQLLNFAEAIAIGPRQPEKLLLILEMYEVLSELIPDVEKLFVDEPGIYITTECHNVLSRLGDCVKATFLEFESAVASNISNSVFPGGGIPHLTRYVMNYARLLTDFSDYLDIILIAHEREEPISFSPNMSTPSGEINIQGTRPIASPLALHFKSLLSILECNLEEKSKLYKDDALGHLFLMNNIHYMAEKVKGSELRTFLGDEWIRKQNWKFQHHAMNYERVTWSSILSLLKDEGLSHQGSNSISKTLVKERFHRFYAAFEDVYRNQTGWSIPNSQLREDLQISISLKVIRPYRSFEERHANHISDRYFKYTADDLEALILDLFEGSPRSVHSCHRR